MTLAQPREARTGALRRWRQLLLAVATLLAAFWAGPAQASDASSVLLHIPPSEAKAGERILLRFVVTEAAAIKQATVVWCSLLEGKWHEAPVLLLTTGKWEAEIPGEAVDDPGIAYYVTAVGVAGDVSAVFASQDQPHPVLVRGAPATVLEREHLAWRDGRRSDLQLSAAYYDYQIRNLSPDKGVNSGPRYYEASLRYRYWVLNKVEYFELGVSSLAGTGDDPLNAANKAGVETGFRHGWAQIGIRPAEFVGLGTRLAIGADESGFRMGIAGIVRVGSPLSTHFVIDTGVTGGVGWHFLAGLNLATVPRVPVAFEAVLTNTPDASRRTGEMVRLRVGRQFTPLLRLNLLGSYQAREGPDHGLGGGAELLLRF